MKIPQTIDTNDDKDTTAKEISDAFLVQKNRADMMYNFADQIPNLSEDQQRDMIQSCEDFFKSRLAGADKTISTEGDTWQALFKQTGGSREGYESDKNSIYGVLYLYSILASKSSQNILNTNKHIFDTYVHGGQMALFLDAMKGKGSARQLIHELDKKRDSDANFSILKRSGDSVENSTGQTNQEGQEEQTGEQQTDEQQQSQQQTGGNGTGTIDEITQTEQNETERTLAEVQEMMSKKSYQEEDGYILDKNSVSVVGKDEKNDVIVIDGDEKKVLYSMTLKNKAGKEGKFYFFASGEPLDRGAEGERYYVDFGGDEQVEVYRNEDNIDYTFHVFTKEDLQNLINNTTSENTNNGTENTEQETQTNTPIFSELKEGNEVLAKTMSLNDQGADYLGPAQLKALGVRKANGEIDFDKLKKIYADQNKEITIAVPAAQYLDAKKEDIVGVVQTFEDNKITEIDGAGDVLDAMDGTEDNIGDYGLLTTDPKTDKITLQHGRDNIDLTKTGDALSLPSFYSGKSKASNLNKYDKNNKKLLVQDKNGNKSIVLSDPANTNTTTDVLVDKLIEGGATNIHWLDTGSTGDGYYFDKDGIKQNVDPDGTNNMYHNLLVFYENKKEKIETQKPDSNNEDETATPKLTSYNTPQHKQKVLNTIQNAFKDGEKSIHQFTSKKADKASLKIFQKNFPDEKSLNTAITNAVTEYNIIQGDENIHNITKELALISLFGEENAMKTYGQQPNNHLTGNFSAFNVPHTLVLDMLNAGFKNTFVEKGGIIGNGSLGGLDDSGFSAIGKGKITATVDFTNPNSYVMMNNKGTSKKLEVESISMKEPSLLTTNDVSNLLTRYILPQNNKAPLMIKDKDKNWIMNPQSGVKKTNMIVYDISGKESTVAHETYHAIYDNHPEYRKDRTEYFTGLSEVKQGSSLLAIISMGYELYDTDTGFVENSRSPDLFLDELNSFSLTGYYDTSTSTFAQKTTEDYGSLIKEKLIDGLYYTFKQFNPDKGNPNKSIGLSESQEEKIKVIINRAEKGLNMEDIYNILTQEQKKALQKCLEKHLPKT